MVDILTAAILVLFIYIGYKNGFLKAAYRVVAFLVSIFIASVLYSYLKELIVGSGLGDVILNLVKTKFVEPGILNNTLTRTALPEYMRSMVETGSVTLSDALSNFISNLVINILSFLLVFILVRAAISIVGRLVNFVSRLPVIRFFDRIGGVVFGLIEGILIIYICLALIYGITPLRTNPSTQQYINESTLTKTMFEHNPIVDMVTPRNYDTMVKP